MKTKRMTNSNQLHRLHMTKKRHLNLFALKQPWYQFHEILSVFTIKKTENLDYLNQHMLSLDKKATICVHLADQ